jgi:hypothetical protein
MAESVVDDALLLVDRIDPRIRSGLQAPAPNDLRRLRVAAALDVPPEYLRFFELLGGDASAIFGDVFTIGVADALQFYKSHYLAPKPLTSSRFLYIGSVSAGELFPHLLFLQTHLPGQFYYGDFEGPRPIVRSDSHPEERCVPFFTDIGELIVFQAWRLHRVRRYAHVAQTSVMGDEGALDSLVRICVSLGIQDAGLTTWCRCLEGPGQAVAVHRRDIASPGNFTVNIGADDPTKRARLLELIRDNLPATRPTLDGLTCR